MRILLTGANGYIGMRLLPQLLDAGHQVVCAVRDRNRLSVDEDMLDRIEIVEIDFLKEPEPERACRPERKAPAHVVLGSEAIASICS